MLAGNQISYVLTRAIIFLSMCERLSMNIKKVMRFDRIYIGANELEAEISNSFKILRKNFLT